jgi:hypothetical protein
MHSYFVPFSFLVFIRISSLFKLLITVPFTINLHSRLYKIKHDYLRLTHFRYPFHWYHHHHPIGVDAGNGY